MIIEDQQLIVEFRCKRKCEWCGKKTDAGLDPAHIFSRGAGRVDHRWNMAALCRVCHTNNHAGHEPTHYDLLAIVAAREGILQSMIEHLVFSIRRARKTLTIRRDGDPEVMARWIQGIMDEAGDTHAE